MCYQWGTALDGPAWPGSPRYEKPNEGGDGKKNKQITIQCPSHPSQRGDLSKQTQFTSREKLNGKCKTTAGAAEEAAFGVDSSVQLQEGRGLNALLGLQDPQMSVCEGWDLLPGMPAADGLRGLPFREGPASLGSQLVSRAWLLRLDPT